MFGFYGGFTRQYRCFSVSCFADRNPADVENGGKILMPPSALEVLSQSNIQYPMLFKLTNREANKSTHCGVLEFVAEEGKIYMPYWMMVNLLVEEGSLVQVKSVSLPVAEYTKIQPQSVDFLDISNPKAVLERALRKFACLTVGDTISISYNCQRYDLSIIELRPQDAASIIECDMDVDFAPPIGYTEPEKPAEEEEDLCPVEALPSPKFKAFCNEGSRLDGKEKKCNLNSQNQPPGQHQRGIPNYDYKPGRVRFFRKARTTPDKKKDDDAAFCAFNGTGAHLRPKRTIFP